MKLAEFNRFCWRQWEDNGTVSTMTLSAADVRELTEDFLVSSAEGSEAADWGAGQVAAGTRLVTMANPASQTPVGIVLALDDRPATATVKYTTVTTRTVDVR